MGITFFLSLFFFAGIIELSAQYASFELHSGSTSGFTGLGVGLNDRETSLASNPAFLASTGSQIQGGILTVHKEKSQSPVLFSPLGFFYSLDEKSGWGIRAKTGFLGQFEAPTKITHYESDLFYSYQWENFFFSIGLGPRLGFRGREQSKIGMGGFLGIGYKKEGWSIGLYANSPGKFSYEDYRGSDPLQEKLPEYAFLGGSLNLSTQWKTYIEAGRIFYEKSFFRLSNSESKPNLDRGLGADLDVNFGMEYQPSQNFKIRGGLGFAGKFNESGQNKRGGALSFGVRFFPFDKEGFFIGLSTLNHSILSQKGKILPENYFFLSGGHLW